MSRLRRQGGFTAIELLLAATLMLLVMGATLTAFEEFGRSTSSTEAQSDSQQEARRAMDQLARELRNHAVANTAAPEGIALAAPYDLIFETVGQNRPAGSANTANVERIRYCLDYTNGADSVLWVQTQRWTTAAAPPVPEAIACPSSLWGSARRVAQNVVNRVDFSDRPVFTYDAVAAADVRRVDVSLYVDTTPGREPKETHLQSAIFLRNANLAPVASFTANVTGSGQLILDATGSSDREGERLQYAWRIDGAAIPPTSAIVDHTGLPNGSHAIELTVMDPGGLYGKATRTVTVP